MIRKTTSLRWRRLFISMQFNAIQCNSIQCNAIHSNFNQGTNDKHLRWPIPQNKYRRMVYDFS